MAANVSAVYIHVVDDVISKVREEFINDGAGESVLNELQAVIYFFTLCISVQDISPIALFLELGYSLTSWEVDLIGYFFLLFFVVVVVALIRFFWSDSRCGR